MIPETLFIGKRYLNKRTKEWVCYLGVRTIDDVTSYLFCTDDNELREYNISMWSRDDFITIEKV